MALSVAAVLTLAACGDSSEPAPTPTATAPPATPTAPVQVTLGEVVWATAVDPATGAPVDELTALPNTSMRVVAAVSASTLPAGTVVQAHWTIDGEPLPALEPDAVTVEDTRANAWLSWTLTWDSDQPWPIGRLGIVIDVNGATQRTDEIPIVRARE